MIAIHPQTLLVALAIEFLALTLVSLPAWRALSFGGGAARWSVGIGAIGVAMGLFSQRGISSGLLTVVVANGCMIYGVQSVHVSVRGLYGIAPLKKWHHLMPFACWAVLSLIWAFDSSPGELASATWRVVVMSVAVTFTAVGIGWVLVRCAPRPWSLGTWYVCVAMLMPGVAQYFRTVHFVNHPEPVDPITAPISAVSVFAAFAACGVFLTYGFFLLINDRLRVELEQANARLADDAATDPLTRVANRRHLDTVAAKEISRARRYGWPLTVLMLDLDHFKRVNDIFGHAIGDEVLRAVANTAQRQLRGHDLLARIGGEEFAILLPQSDLLGAEVLARRVLEDIRDTKIEVLDGMIITVSIGIAALKEGDESIAPLLHRADVALYRAKAAGRNRVAMDESAMEWPAAE